MRASEDGKWSWDPESVKPGEVVLAPTLRYVKLHTVVEPEGTRIFADCADGALLCKHGELGSSIGTWCQLEKVAEREGRPTPPRPSHLCDCKSTSGLIRKPDSALAEPDRIPPTLYGHLCATEGIPTILVNGIRAPQLPFTSGEQAAFLTPDGRIICRHGRLRTSLIHMKRHGRHARCDCMPRGLPHRSSRITLKLGQTCGRKRASGAALAELPIS